MLMQRLYAKEFLFTVNDIGRLSADLSRRIIAAKCHSLSSGYEFDGARMIGQNCDAAIHRTRQAVIHQGTEIENSFPAPAAVLNETVFLNKIVNR
ncbi:hypothetical protein niasHT_021686 [Heterodera trifolii]|uniref:Uncharacterized protein n=1 Tax=Heterodera trifolii TaxID=157864 RepID=A0ABD2KRS7_9BILA